MIWIGSFFIQIFILHQELLKHLLQSRHGGVAPTCNGIILLLEPEEELIQILPAEGQIQAAIFRANHRQHKLPHQPVLTHHGIETNLLCYIAGLGGHGMDQLLILHGFQASQTGLSHAAERFLRRELEKIFRHDPFNSLFLCQAIGQEASRRARLIEQELLPGQNRGIGGQCRQNTHDDRYPSQLVTFLQNV